MSTGFLNSAKNALTKCSSSSKTVSDHPLRNDNPDGDLGNSHHESSKKAGVTTRGGGAHREEDISHTHKSQPARESMQAFPRKEITPPRTIQEPSHCARQTSVYECGASIKKKELQDQLSVVQNTLYTMPSPSEARKKEIERLLEEIRRLDSAKALVEKEAGKKICDLERKIQLQDQDIRNLRERLRISEERHSQTKRLLDDRTAELKGAQVFLTTADRYSGADIIKMAESLNAEIFQVSALMAELLADAPIVEDSVQRAQYIQEYQGYLDGGRKILGSRIVDYLITESTKIRVDPLPLQLAFQALLTGWCIHEVNHFCEGPAGESLKQIYEHIYKSEIQAVAGRWRVMTSVQTMNSSTPSRAKFVGSVILALMSICGWFKSQDTSRKATLDVEKCVLRVETMWKALKVVIKQEITAAEISVFGIDRSCKYDAATMDDAYMDTRSDGTTNPDKWVLCTVGVGLRRDVSKRSENGKIEIYREVILKPKVALHSVLLGGSGYTGSGY